MSASEPTPRERVFLLHGFMGTCTAHFANQLNEWRDSKQVVGIDLPGHGKVAPDAEGPYWTCALEYVTTILDRFGGGHVIGLSYLGGAVAARLAAERPEFVTSLILSGFVPEIPQVAVTGWVLAFRSLAEQHEEIAAEYERLHGPRWEETLRHVCEHIVSDYPGTVRITREHLAELSQPVLLVNGTRRTDEREVAGSLPVRPGVLDVALLPGAGHIAPHDSPRLFNAHAEEFWRAQGQGVQP